MANSLLGMFGKKPEQAKADSNGAEVQRALNAFGVTDSTDITNAMNEAQNRINQAGGNGMQAFIQICKETGNNPLSLATNILSKLQNGRG